jgi:hypothetical protein
MTETILTLKDTVHLTDVGGNDEVQSNGTFQQPGFGYSPMVAASPFRTYEIEKEQRNRKIRRGLLGWGVVLGWMAIIVSLASANSRAFHILAFLTGWLGGCVLVVCMLVGAKHLRSQRA